MKRRISIFAVIAAAAVLSGCATGRDTRSHLVTPLSLINYRSTTVFVMPIEGQASGATRADNRLEGGGKVDATVPLGK